MKSVLHLTLRREWFAAIAARTKRLEYRAQTPYWRKRLEGRQFDVIRFRNGYARNAPEMEDCIRRRLCGECLHAGGRAAHQV
jgi:hypothetical protein